MLLMFRVITGENWNRVMNDCRVQPPLCTNYETEVEGYYLPNDCGSEYGACLCVPVKHSLSVTVFHTHTHSHSLSLLMSHHVAGAIVFFVSFYALGTYTIMNLFVAIVIDNLSFCYHLEKSDISEELLKHYRKAWFKLSLKVCAVRVVPHSLPHALTLSVLPHSLTLSVATSLSHSHVMSVSHTVCLSHCIH